LGSGLNTFGDVYGKYASVNTTNYKANFAHNEYLQHFSDCGFFGLAILVVILLACGIFVYRAFKVRRSRYFRAVGAGAVLGCLTFVVHAFFDFNFKIPSNFILFVFLLSFSILALTTSQNGSREIPDLKKSRTHFLSLQGLTYMLFLMIVSVLFAVWSFRAMLSSNIRERAFISEGENRTELFKRALSLNRLDSRNHMALAGNYHDLSRFDEASNLLNKARNINRTNSYIIYELARNKRSLGDLSAAVMLMEKAVKEDRMNGQWHKTYQYKREQYRHHSPSGKRH